MIGLPSNKPSPDRVGEEFLPDDGLRTELEDLRLDNIDYWTRAFLNFSYTADVFHCSQHPVLALAGVGFEKLMVASSRNASGELVALSVIRPIGRGRLGMKRLSIDRGPCAITADYLVPHIEALSLLLADRGAWLRVNPYICGETLPHLDRSLRKIGFKNTSGTGGDYTSTIAVDLTVAEDELWQSLSATMRRSIRKADRLGITVETAETTETVSRFFSELKRFTQEKNLESSHIDRYLKVFEVLERTGLSAKMFFTVYAGEVAAGIAILPAGRRAIFELGFSRSSQFSPSIPLTHKLHWKAMLWAKSVGYSAYDLGGYWSDKGVADSINRFKLGFSSESQPVAPYYYYPLSPISGRLLEVALTGRDAVGFSLKQ